MEGSAVWQGAVLGGILLWLFSSSYLNLTLKLRSFLQPFVIHYVQTGTPILLKIQSYRVGFLDALFSVLSCVVSVPFYTAFLPLLFWSGHGQLARQMTLLMAFCDYIGNCIKDVVSAPRPASPPVRRVTATKDEEENALEYGLPSSHTLNTVCLSGLLACGGLAVEMLVMYSDQELNRWHGIHALPVTIQVTCYLLHYVLTHTQLQGAYINYFGVSLACLFVALVGLGRIYLGMHSLIDVVAGLFIGLGILGLWLTVYECIDNFVVSGQNVTTFWAALSFLLLFAYPTPELPTPSFEFHTAFNGVALGIVSGVQQTYHQFHHDNVPRLFSSEMTIPVFMGRMLVGIPTILIVKFCSKTLAKWTIPVVANTLGIPIKSTTYIPTLNGAKTGEKSKAFDVDTGIRFLQYAGLAWSVVDLVPSIFSYVSL
ncbi:dihydrosphingosine 1-phosphate phosphatase-like protein [Trifolium pratense]|uniref:Dihydrosphingosine 1-phosphate phosphatase-like protein n=1 Tax=Trifolium pratense TaxID=57577 RepID=A0A2K3NLP0_TRIPR|nr:dihydrosphingosine 1-phosphate phosphatase-like protein [Trifolium pratense]